jgi:hypothetical protein
LEDSFCRDFSCCNLELKDLHELLQHFEDVHVDVRLDSDDEDLFTLEHMDDSSDFDSPLTFTDVYFQQQSSEIYVDPKNRKRIDFSNLTNNFVKEEDVEMEDVVHVSRSSSASIFSIFHLFLQVYVCNIRHKWWWMKKKIVLINAKFLDVQKLIKIQEA